MEPAAFSAGTLSPGTLVRVRSRSYLVEGVTPAPEASVAGQPGFVKQSPLVRLACLEDDALGEELTVLWDAEIDAQVVGQSTWDDVASKGFDQPHLFAAFLHTLRWNCVTATNPRLFQAPYRAGIQVKAYQLEPLRKALQMPRVNLFIADDVGLGKTIEAGLIVRELLLRQKVRRVIVAAPPSVVLQWRDEMEQRFGLTFAVYDRDFVAARRRERGYGVNPWTTHPRFIVSHALLRDEAHAEPLRDLLGTFEAQSLLILDEAHNAAPASGQRYAIDSHFTRGVRDLARRFEHRLFLSATPHNGHSNSFAALLEILDPQRFCRGVPVRNKASLDQVMVRRLKADLRAHVHDFPERRVLALSIDGLPADAPELALSRLLQQVRRLREARLAEVSASERSAALLVLTSLQKRLLSSIEAFARTLAVHRRALEKHAAEARSPGAAPARPAVTSSDRGNDSRYDLLLDGLDADGEHAERPEDDVEAEIAAQVEAATACSARRTGDDLAREVALLEQMTVIANAARHKPDSRMRLLIDWLRDHLCPGIARDGGRADASAPWAPRRVLIFTEYTDTKRYLVEQLEAALAGTDGADDRILTFHGGMGDERREEIKRAFNAEPDQHPVRILVATDAAREGVNLQNHCADLFHFDVPWNPGRMEQRNGRIDRKLQQAKEVRCHYFVLPQRAEDRVLDVLVRKTDTILRELGSLTPVVQRGLDRLLKDGIRDTQEDLLRKAIGGIDQAGDTAASVAAIRDELEPTRDVSTALGRQLKELDDLLEDSRLWLGLDDDAFRDALSASLAMLGAEPLSPLNADAAVMDRSAAAWRLPALDKRAGDGLSWATTLDALRAPRKPKQNPAEWRREAPIRPVVFKDPGKLSGDTVHLHLEHRVTQRLLGRFLSQGFVHHDLTRACVCLTDDHVPRVIALGRLSLYGQGATRLHDTVLAVTASWEAGDERGRRKLKPLKAEERADVLELLETSLGTPRLREVPDRVKETLKTEAERDVAELRAHLVRAAEAAIKTATRLLADRGEKEAREMRAILEGQRASIVAQMRKVDADLMQRTLDLPGEERGQLERDRKYWPQRLDEIDLELTTEPERIQAMYDVKAVRVEPAGLVYLWPVSKVG